MYNCNESNWVQLTNIKLEYFNPTTPFSHKNCVRLCVLTAFQHFSSIHAFEPLIAKYTISSTFFRVLVKDFIKPIYFLMEYIFLQGIHFAEYLLLVFEILEMCRECREQYLLQFSKNFTLGNYLLLVRYRFYQRA